MPWQPRPKEALKPGTPPPSTVRRALDLTGRELTCLGAGACATAASWALAWCWS
jgi:hypothetical protein